MDLLATAARFGAAVQDAVARERIELPWGVALRSPDLPGVFDANLARLSGRNDTIGAAELLADVERLRGDLWFDKLFIDDQATGERLRGDLEAAGFETTALAVLAWPDQPVGAAPDAREATQGEAHPVRVAINTEELDPENADYAPHIARLQERIAEEIDARVFVAPADGEIGALCSLYAIGGVAQVEEVSTLRARRGEGLAGAVVRGAVQAALDTAPELVFIEADEDDWMKAWYERIGFRPIGRTWRFTRIRA